MIEGATVDADQFDVLATRLTTHLTRRRSLGLLGVLGITGLGLTGESAAKKKKKKKKKHKPRKPKGNPPPTGCGKDDTVCTCQPVHAQHVPDDAWQCCSENVYTTDIAPFGTLQECLPGSVGDRCHTNADCTSGSCVGYHCQGCSGTNCPPYYHFTRVFGNTGTGPVQFNEIKGLEVTRDGNLLVADFGNHRVQEITPKGQFVRQFGVTGVPGSDNAHLRQPAGVAVDKDGNIYIADAGNHRVQKFSPSGTWLNAWGSGAAGSDVYHLNYPRDVAFDSRNYLYIADTINNRVQVFTTAGAFVRSLTHAGFFDVNLVVIDPDDHAWVRSGYIWHEFDANGQYLRKITLWSDTGDPLAIAPDGSLLHVEGSGEGRASDHVAQYSTGEMLVRSIDSSSAPSTAISRAFEINAITVDRAGNLYFSTFNTGSTTLDSNLIFVYTKESASTRSKGPGQARHQKKHQKRKQTHKGR